MLIDQNITGILAGNSAITQVMQGSTVVWTAGKDYSREYLTVENRGTGNTLVRLEMPIGHGSVDKTVQVSKNGGAWTDMCTSAATAVYLNQGDTLRVKGTEEYYSFDNDDDIYYVSRLYMAGGDIEISGNIMSLFYGDNFIGQTQFPNGHLHDRQLFGFFSGTSIVDAENLILPAVMTIDCYSYMFENCTYLRSAPKFDRATIFGNACRYMFKDCTNLTYLHDFNCDTFGIGFYMFLNCTSLQSITMNCNTLSIPDYGIPFYGCTSLNYVKCMATTITQYTNENWLPDAPMYGTFVKKAGVLWPSRLIPSHWTVIEEP